MRFLYAHASQELAKARRHTYPMSLVEMEIENFQKLVEQHGLETAEKMLKELAATLQRQLRNCDVLARLSENEFAVVLSMTGPSQARFLIQRLSDAAARFRFKTGSDTLDEVRVNFGCASFPENGRTAESLFLHANRDRTQSMKRSKQVWPMGVRQVRGNVIPFHIQ
jgi:diguanylate cyclase (GGDEF)-like protein